MIGLESGRIFFMEHETGKVTELAADFKAFIALCESAPVNKVSVKSVEEREKELIAKGSGGVITESLRDMWRAEIKKYSALSLEKVTL